MKSPPADAFCCRPWSVSGSRLGHDMADAETAGRSGPAQYDASVADVVLAIVGRARLRRTRTIEKVGRAATHIDYQRSSSRLTFCSCRAPSASVSNWKAMCFEPLRAAPPFQARLRLRIGFPATSVDELNGPAEYDGSPPDTGIFLEPLLQWPTHMPKMR